MARDFNGSTQLLRNSNAVVSVAPLTMACWFYATNVTTGNAYITIADSATDSSYWGLWGRGEVDDKVYCAQGDNVSPSFALTSTTFSANTWHHAAAVFTSNSSRAVFLDGGGKGTDATTVGNPPSLDRTSIGILDRLNPVFYHNGYVAEPAIWSAALTDAEVVSLALGYSPELIRPQSLIEYWRLFGNQSPEPGRVNGYDMTLVNAPTKAAHPPMIYPSGPFTPVGRRPTNDAILHETQGYPLLETSEFILLESGEVVSVAEFRRRLIIAS